MSTIYVVQGATGEYPEDHREWMVKAFKTKKKAQAFVVRVTQEGIELLEKHGDHSYLWHIPDEVRTTWLDPNFNVDGLHFNYSYEAVHTLTTVMKR